MSPDAHIQEFLPGKHLEMEYVNIQHTSST